MDLPAGIVVAAVASALGAATAVVIGRRRPPSATPEVEELRRLLRASDEERARMDLVLSHMLEGVLLFAPDGRAVFANAAAERHLGPLPASITSVLPTAVRDVAERAAATRESGSVDAEVGSPPRWLRATAVPVGADASVLLVVRDVTEARRLEQIRRDFVANASHELKTPAASIQAAAETIGTAALDDPAVVPRFAAQLEREAVRLSRIVSDLLDLSRLESGSNLGDLVALEAIVRDEFERFDEQAAEAGVTLALETSPGARVRGAPRDLALLVRNLVDNAIRYTRPGGDVRVSVSSHGEEVALSVTDTGVGIPQRDLPRVFERFYRVDRARSRETGGTGLGLAIVRHVVENHGGTIEVRSELGRGTTFEVRLPAFAPAEGSAPPEPAPSDAAAR